MNQELTTPGSPHGATELKITHSLGTQNGKHYFKLHIDEYENSDWQDGNTDGKNGHNYICGSGIGIVHDNLLSAWNGKTFPGMGRNANEILAESKWCKKTEWMMLLTWIQVSIQSRWNRCRQGNVRSVSFGSNFDKQIRHSLTASPETQPRSDSDDVDWVVSVNLLVGRTLISSVFKPRWPTSPFDSAKSHRAWQT